MSLHAPYPQGRPRRLRRDEFTRNLVRENTLTAHDLIYPVFVLDGEKRREAVGSMPGVERLSLDLLLPVAERCVALGIPVMALFPVIDPRLKTADGQEAWNPKGLVPRVVKELKARFPGLGVMAGKIWRIGLMGYSCKPENVMLCLSALGSVLSDMGLSIHVGDAEAAAHGAYASLHAKAAQAKKKRTAQAA